MTDPPREYRVVCYISLDRIPRHVEERAAEVWTYAPQNRIPISRGLAQSIEDWGIQFQTIITHPYTPTLLTPRPPAIYIQEHPKLIAGAPPSPARRPRTEETPEPPPRKRVFNPLPLGTGLPTPPPAPPTRRVRRFHQGVKSRPVRSQSTHTTSSSPTTLNPTSGIL